MRPLRDQERPIAPVDGITEVCGEALEESEVVEGDEDWAEHFAGHEQMPNVGAGEGLAVRGVPAVACGVACMAIAARLDGEGITGEGGIAEADLAVATWFTRKGVGVSAVAGWKDTIEHIDTGHDGGDDISLVADAHEVAGFVFGHLGRGVADNLGDVFWGLPNCYASNGVSGEVDVADAFDGPVALLEVGAALDDAEEGLFARAGVGSFASLEPSDGALVCDLEALGVVVACFFGGVSSCGVAESGLVDWACVWIDGWGAVVEGHHDVWAEFVLDLHGDFWVEADHGAVED